MLKVKFRARKFIRISNDKKSRLLRSAQFPGNQVYYDAMTSCQEAEGRLSHRRRGEKANVNAPRVEINQDDSDRP
jgi:hypothetical protein